MEARLCEVFRLTLTTRSSVENIELGQLIGARAVVSMHGGEAAGWLGARNTVGICSSARLLPSLSDGFCYELVVVPSLWLLTQRTGYRIFQNQSAVDIVRDILAEWGITARWQLSSEPLPALDYRVQHGESDFQFVRRLLAEVGLHFWFDAEDRDAPVIGSCADRAREVRVIPYVPALDAALSESHVRAIRVRRELRPSRLTVYGFEPNRRLDTTLSTNAEQRGAELERQPTLEQRVYAPLDFAGEAGPQAAVPGYPTSLADEVGARRLAQLRLEAARSDGSLLELESNAIELLPGARLRVSGHEHTDLAAAPELVVVSVDHRCESTSRWTATVVATFADTPFRSAAWLEKPQLHGVESAVVVGPTDQEIFTDAAGRVRVQFPWDASGDFDERSSCWIRVSQGWVGSAAGALAVPRVGQEVIVGYFGGDPDRPVIVGRLFNATAPTPAALPAQQTLTVLRSRSTPGGVGYNELSFDDQAGRERVHLRAERDLDVLVRADERQRVGGSRSVELGGDEQVTVGGNRAIAIGGSRDVSVSGNDVLRVAGNFTLETLRSGSTGETPVRGAVVEVSDGKIRLTTGEASITLEGGRVLLEGEIVRVVAKQSVVLRGQRSHISAAGDVVVKSGRGSLFLDGGPDMYLNPSASIELDPRVMPVESPPDLDLQQELLEAEDFAMFNPREPDALATRLASGGSWDPNRWGADYREYGIFHLGLQAAAGGIPPGVMARQFALIQKSPRAEGDAGDGVVGGVAPFGMDPEEYDLLREGALYHRKLGGGA